MTVRWDTIANVATTMMCVVVIYAVSDRLIFSKSIKTGATGYRIGQQLTGSMAELPVDNSRVTAIVVVTSSCRYCSESTSFYRELLALESQARPGDFKTVFVGFMGSEDAEAFVTKNDLQGSSVAPTPKELRVHIDATPTLLLVDEDKRIVGSWVGKLTEDDEKDVVSTVNAVLKYR